jgi:phospholipid/cholesterol/gamma-HCH transport system substrate-binding protein
VPPIGLNAPVPIAPPPPGPAVIPGPVAPTPAPVAAPAPNAGGPAPVDFGGGQ